MYTNYYNPYMYKKRFNFKKIDFNKILSGTSKTLNVINQAMPIYYQVKPIIANAKTLFRVANIIKSEPIIEEVATASEAVKDVSSNPAFFL